MRIIDSSFASLAEATQGTLAPQDIVRDLALVDVSYVSFDRCLHQGQLVVHRDLAQDVEEIFSELLRLQFPIAKVIPIVQYGWDDAASMADNNCSAFNYRLIAGTNRPSWHARGRALDPNPVQNPFTKKGQPNQPAGAVYNPSVPGTIVPDGPVVRLFLERGWEWGGQWTDPIDYQHFQKPG